MSLHHVFISYNSQDAASALALAVALKDRGLDPWFDQWHLPPGRPWLRVLEAGLEASAAVAVLIGAHGLGPVQQEEMSIALHQARRQGKPVIPVLFAAATPLPSFLALYGHVDLSNGLDPEGLARLVWGITGERPVPIAAPLIAISALGPDYDQGLRTIFAQLAHQVSVAEIRAVCLRSAALSPIADWPREPTHAAWCDWLLDRAPLRNGRHPLYDILAFLKSRAGGEALLTRDIEDAMRRLAAHHPGLCIDPLPEAVPAASADPALVEVVFLSSKGSAVPGYEVCTFWHSPGGSKPATGPQRDQDSGGPLELGVQAQVSEFALTLMDAKVAWGVAVEDCVFLFRVPRELMLHPFEDWPCSQLKGLRLGGTHPVVLGARRRSWGDCDTGWRRLAALWGRPLRDCVACCPGCSELDSVALTTLTDSLAQTPCLALEQVPDLAECETDTPIKVVETLGLVALWPRSQAAEAGFWGDDRRRLGRRPAGRGAPETAGPAPRRRRPD